jgi:hypothetical protein
VSGIKSDHIAAFHRKLRARGTSITQIAAQIYCGRSHVTQVLNGSRPGAHTWPKLERVLTTAELALLGRVPRGTMSHMEQPV